MIPALKAVKLDGEFIWHHHDEEDEIFYVVRGRIDMYYRSGDAEVVESVAAPGTEVLLIERADTLNTGNVLASERRRTPQII